MFSFPPIVESRNGINLRVARRGATGASGGGGEIGKGKRGGDSRTEQTREAKDKDGNAWRTGLALGGRCGALGWLWSRKTAVRWRRRKRVHESAARTGS